MEKKPISKLAIVSLVLPVVTIILTIILVTNILNSISVTSILVFTLVPNILAVVLGIIALITIGVRCKIMAVIGIISGFLITVFLVTFGGSFFDDILYHNARVEGHRLSNAISNLSYIRDIEELWRIQDSDRNGIKDYWTYDVSCLHRMYRVDNYTKINLIDLDVARADACPADVNNTNFFGDDPKITPLDESKPIFYGYYFRAMLTNEQGMPYNQNPVGTKKILATNSNKFAFVAYPAIYGITGTYTVIINEKGNIYFRDTGSDGNKIVLQWPNQEELEGEKAKWNKE